MNKTQSEINQMMDYFKQSTFDVYKNDCIRPCSTMDIYFGVLFNDGATFDGTSFLKIYLKSTVKV